jgi:hypothetical protein
MPVTKRDPMEQMIEAEELLATAKELREKVAHGTFENEQQAQEQLNMYNIQITALSSEAHARMALANFYWITG